MKGLTNMLYSFTLEAIKQEHAIQPNESAKPQTTKPKRTTLAPQFSHSEAEGERLSSP
jgi:hypothetical protein